ncbi:glycosyltransferase family 2 protein [Candidatus Pantoea formicae]|uniref:glycosyltransferase family 2 protein n=1 Tax=Candidatus Pantoea formicae TaxID=2608355 RepID=UPI003EDB6698
MFIITMAGLSSRFFKAGYDIPKYQLPLHGQSVFYQAVNSFNNYFKTDKFVFVARDVYSTIDFINAECAKLDIENFEIIVLADETRGQAETAVIALKQLEITEEEVFVFNIDTVRHNYIKPLFLNDADGYLEVFEDSGEHWSFIEPDNEGNVLRTTEKVKISDLCSDGLYYFKHSKYLINAFDTVVKNGETTKGEYYIAPLYNLLIADSKTIKYEIISEQQIDFCGTPDEYRHLITHSEKFGY